MCEEALAAYGLADYLTRPAGQLYCQNLSLFGKLFIDIKTLFFDCDNCEVSNHFSHGRRILIRGTRRPFWQSCSTSSRMRTHSGIMSWGSSRR